MTTGGEISFTTKASELEIAGSPLRKFEGRFVELVPRLENGRVIVDLNFDQLKVIECVGTYHFPVAVISIRYPQTQPGRKPSERSGWGLLLKSAEAIGHDDLIELKSHRLYMECEPDHSYGTNQQTGQEMVGPVWRVIKTLDTEGAKPSEDQKLARLLDLAHGKTVRDFAQAVFNDPAVREFGSALVDNSLIPLLVSQGNIQVEPAPEGERLWVVGRARS